MKTAVHQYEDKLLEFAYGELPTPEAQAVEAHVRDCANCAKALSEIRAVRSTMSALPMEAAPDAGLESLLAYAEQAASRAKATAPSRGWRRFLAPLASAMALVVVGVVAWRANQDFDPDPAMMAIQAEREAAKTVAAKEEAPAVVRKTAAPIAAATPSEAPKEEEAQVDGAGRALRQEETTETRKGGLVDTFAESKRDAPSKKSLAPLSTTKRGKLAEEGALDSKQVALADDYSNAAQRGAYKPAAAPPPPPSQGPGAGGLGFGLGTGSSMGGVEPAPAESAGEKRKDKAPSRQQAAAPSAPAAVPAPAPKSSYELSGLTKKRPYSGTSSSAPVDAEADELAVQRSDALSADRDSRVAERERSQSRAGLLEAARVAGSQGNREEELRLVLAVLAGGPSGYEKVEALKRACDALESLGDFERADPYCDQLVREFPQTAAAGAVAKRRNAVQRAAPATKAGAKAVDEAKPAATEAAQPAY